MDPVWHLTLDGSPASPEGEGFVHASFAAQLQGTLAAHFATAEQLLLLRLDPATLGDSLVLQPSRDGQLFPHIHRALGPADVIERRRLVRGSDGRFDLSGVPGATPGQGGHVPFIALQVVGVERPWGGRRIARRFGWDSCAAHGEWWLVSCHPKAVTPLRGGPSLSEWIDGPGQALGLPTSSDFPLLLKFLDAGQNLSVQVHPDDDVARRHGLPRGKSEAWHILDTEQQAWLALGPAPGLTAADVAATVRAARGDQAVLASLSRQPARAGDTWLVEAGTIHALSAGIACFEVQQNSDVTYRIYDWNRAPRRALHLDRAQEAAHRAARGRRIADQPAGPGWTTLLDEPAFRLCRARPAAALEVAPRASFAGLTVLAGRGTATAGEVSCALAPGGTLLVFEPTAVTGEGLDLLLAEPPA